jgi:hypothetical protein
LKLKILFTLILLIPLFSFGNSSLVVKINQSYPELEEEISFRDMGQYILFSTNTWNYQKLSNKSTDLGIYNISGTEKVMNNIKLLKAFYKRLKNRNPQYKKSLKRVPHAISISLNEQIIDSNHPYFKQIEKLLTGLIRENKDCIRCAQYQLAKGKIIRSINKKKDKSYHLKNFECKKDSKTILTCLDKEFGVFKLKDTPS